MTLCLESIVHCAILLALIVSSNKLQMDNYYFTRFLWNLSLIYAEGKIPGGLEEVGVEAEPALPKVRELLRQPDAVAEVVVVVDERM